jgi:outer membrane protein TolC
LFYAAIGTPDVAQPPPNAGDDAIGVQAGMTIPLWFGKNKGRVNRARAEMKKAKAAKTTRINETNTQIRSFYFRLENARRLTELYHKELLPQAARAMEIAETWFREGQSSFSDFIETQAVWYNFQLALARARADYGKNLARLERLVGQSITERKKPSGGEIGKGEK